MSMPPECCPSLDTPEAAGPAHPGTHRSRGARSVSFAWPLVVVLLSPSSLFVESAAAAAPGEASPAAAPSEEDLINRGIALREARNDGAALEIFRQAYGLKKSPRALAQVALAEQAL